MLPGLIRSPWMPASSAAMAYFHWKWMSAMTGTVACSAIVFRASASSQWGTATRTMSTPVATRDAICWSVAFTSAVFVVVMDWTRTGASPPTSTHPTLIFREIRRGTAIRASILRAPPSASFSEHVEHDFAVLRLVELEQDQPLPLTEHRLSGADRDGMRGRAEQHVADVRLAVRAFVSF